MFRLTAGFLAASLVASVAAAQPAPQTQFINQQIAAKWKEAEIKRTAAKATDHEFLRRVFIDLIGRIATAEEVVDFERDSSPDKRAKLVKRLLHATEYQPKGNNGQRFPLPGGKKDEYLTFDYTSEYAKHWATVWTVWLMSRTGDGRYRDQMEIWLEVAFRSNTSYRDVVVQLLTATGKTNENGAVNFIAQQLGEANPAAERSKYGAFDAVPITSRVTRLFLGLQIQCAQCHDHPFNREWVQSDFWGVNAFFRQVARTGTPTSPLNNRNMAALAQLELRDDPAVNSDGVLLFEKRNGTPAAVNPGFLKDVSKVLKELDAGKLERSTKTLDKMTGGTRREALARYVVTHDNFAKAYVNRMWGHLFGRGLNAEASVDDFGTNNEIVHKELLDKLAAEFAGSGYDPKALFEWICTSDVYNLSHVGLKEYADPKYDPYFARMPLKALSPEVLLNSLLTATRTEELRSDEDVKRLREAWTAKLVRNFGDDEGNEATFDGTIIQALMMMNGPELNGVVSARNANAVERVMLKHSRTGVPNVDLILDELFLMTLNRRPTYEERVKIKTLQARGAIVPGEAPKTVPPPTPPKKGGRPPKGPPATPGIVMPSLPTDVTFYQDVFWALLNTNEFMLNH